jgi:RNA polymerase sigma factor (sigma-70 family)
MESEQIIKKHDELLKRLAKQYRYLGYDDIYNECVVYLLEAYRKGVKNPEYYVNNRIIKYCQEEHKFREHISIDDVEDYSQPDNVIDNIYYQEMIDGLPERERKIIKLYFEYGYNEREIAKMMNMSQQLVSYLKTKAINIMKEYVT